MKRVILLARVSTKYQSYEDQTKETIKFAERDGYKIDEIEIIQDKESALKLSDEERQGLNKMYAAMNDPNNQIETVYCWELSRLSRKPQTLYKIKEELINRKINLRIVDKGFSLFNEKREVDPTSELILGFYITFCENEMRVKQDRTQRAKRGRASNNGYNGGNIKYGYTNYVPAPSDSDPQKKEKTKLYHIDPEQEEVVKLLFELYSTGKYGFSKLHKELLSRGKNVNIRIIGQILRSKEYIGETMPERTYTERIKGKERIITRYERSYPPIISKELFEKCRKVAIKNNNNIDKSKSTYYANKLIKCSACGSALVAMKNNIIYRCMHRYSSITKKECSGNDSININVIDSILWGLAKQLEIDFIVNFNEKQFEIWQKEIAELQDKIDNSENQYNVILGNEIKKLRKAISVETMNDKELEAIAIKQIKADKQRIEQDKINYKLEIERLNKLIIEAQTKYCKTANIPEVEKVFIPQMENIQQEVNNTTEKQRYDLIHKHIKKVSVSKVPDIKATKKIEIECYNGKTETYYYAFRLKDKSKQIYQVIDVDSDYSFVEYYSFEERFIRHSTKNSFVFDPQLHSNKSENIN